MVGQRDLRVSRQAFARVAPGTYTRRHLAISAGIIALLVAAAVTNAVVIQMVRIGDPANEADTQVMDDGTTGYGSVGHEYYISKYEVTNTEYTAFLNAVAATDTNELYHPSMGSHARGGITQSGSSSNYTYSVKTNMDNKPVNYVNFWDACRFANWLHNGQPTRAQSSTTTEDGAYDMSLGANVVRKGGAQWFICSENEWYKAAYYKGGGTSAGYWDYATQSDTAPTEATANSVGDINNPGANVVNYKSAADWNGQNGNVTTVGSAGDLSDSSYGTADQGGNLREWNEATLGSNRGYRGGGYSSSDALYLKSDARYGSAPAFHSAGFGIRIASVVPEPVTLAVLGVGSLTLLIRRRHRK